MNSEFCMAQDNREIANELIGLMKEEETDPSVYRRFFSQLDLVSKDYVVVTGCVQRLAFSKFFCKLLSFY